MQINKYGLTFIGFGLICLLTSWVLSSHTGASIEQRFPPTGGKFGPIEIKEENTVLEIVISQRVSDRHWSNIDAKVSDSYNNNLFAFSEGLWFETGYDADGAWQEGKDKYDMSVTFAKSGRYFIDFTATNSQDQSVGDIFVEANEKMGSSVAYLWLGLLSLIIGVVIIYLTNFSSNPVNNNQINF